MGRTFVSILMVCYLGLVGWALSSKTIWDRPQQQFTKNELFIISQSLKHFNSGLQELIESAALRAKFGDYAREYTISTFSPKNQLDSHLRAYEIVLGLKP